MSATPVRHHRELIVWQRGMELLIATYALARLLPREELFGLTSQLRRAAASVPSNIAEGHARFHRSDFIQHLSIARGSLAELETLLDACEALRYVGADEVTQARGLADEVRRMLGAMIMRLKAKKAPRKSG
jgi:four helix bundle protein